MVLDTRKEQRQKRVEYLVPGFQMAIDLSGPSWGKKIFLQRDEF